MKNIFSYLFGLIFFLSFSSCNKKPISEEVILGLKLGAPFNGEIDKALKKLKYNSQYKSYYINIYEDARRGVIEGYFRLTKAFDNTNDTALYAIEVCYFDVSGVMMPVFEDDSGVDYSKYFRCSSWCKDKIIKLFEEKYGICKTANSESDFNNATESVMFIRKTAYFSQGIKGNAVNEGDSFYFKWIKGNIVIDLQVALNEKEFNQDTYHIKCTYRFIDDIATKLNETTKTFEVKNNSKI